VGKFLDGFHHSTSMEEGYNGIFVEVDRFSNYVTSAPTNEPCLEEEVARMFFKHFMKMWGLPLNIVSNRDT
jgi:hypothetical protein